MNLKYLVLFLFSFFVTLYSQQDIDKQILKGLDNCYNFNFQQAEDDFNNLVKKYPDDPRGYHYKSTIYLWYYLCNKDKSDFDKFINYSNIALDKGEKYLDQKPDDEMVLYIMGTTQSCRAIVYAKAEKYVDAAWASKKSESYLTQALERNPKLSDAYLGLGLYNFAVSQIPSGFRWALSLAGIKGDKDTGLKYVKKAAAEGYYSKTEAQYYLSQMFSEVMFDVNNANSILKQLTKKYPDNLLFSYSMTVVEMKRKNLTSAEKYIARLLSEDKTYFKQLISFSNFLMGDICYKKNEFSNAKKYYLNFLTSSNDNDYKGIAYYRLGVASELTGNRQEAEKYFQFSGRGNMDLDDDIFAKRRGGIYAKRTIADAEADLIKGANFLEQGNYKIAIDTLMNLVHNVKSEKVKAEAFYYLSEAYYNLKNYEQAIKFGSLAKSVNSSDEKWIKPYAEYYLAKSYYSSGNNTEAQNCIDRIDDYSDYDYQNRLKNLVFAFRSGAI